MYGYCPKVNAKGEDIREPECWSCKASEITDGMRDMLNEYKIYKIYSRNKKRNRKLMPW
jgi:hypothetical protein